MSQRIYKLKDGRACYPFPVEAQTSSFTVKPGYVRVVIPFTSNERRNSRKLCHVQIVKQSNLTLVKEKALVIGHRN